MAAGRFSCFGKDGLIVPAVAMGVQKDGTSAGGGWFIFVIRVFCIDGGGVAPDGCCQELGLIHCCHVHEILQACAMLQACMVWRSGSV